MAGLNRYTQQLFGSAAGVDEIGEFGSLFAGSGVFTTSIPAMMSLSNWLTGWFGAAIGGNSPAIEDMNAVCTVFAYQIAYLMERGVPEWDSATTYFTHDIVASGGVLYISLTDNNTGNAVSTTADWTIIGGSVLDTLGDWLYGGTNGAQTKLAGNTSSTPAFPLQTGTGTASAAPVLRPFLAPTIQKFLSGSGTYTLPSSPVQPLYIRVRLVGAGGGGSGAGTSGTGGNGSSGGNTTFSVITASGGAGGVFNSVAAAGGAASLGSGPIGIAIAGGYGGSGQIEGTAAASALTGGHGGVSALGGAGASGFNNGNSFAATANSGSGGGGGGSSAVSNSIITGTGGGAGGFVDCIISGTLLATIAASGAAYSVGAGGVGGTNGTSGQPGSSGAAGMLEITEHYQ